MKKVSHILTLIFMSLSVFGQNKTDDKERDLAFYKATNKWFSAWKLVSKDIYKINKVKPVDFVFFDDKYVYSTSIISVKNGITVKGNDLMNLKLQWKRKLHHDSLTLPDKSVIPLALMSFAAEVPNESKSFFVMPLPSFWTQAKVFSRELGTENLITGVFIHEFSHSQQMQNFGKKLTEYEKQNTFEADFSDDIVQNLFANDTNYSKGYKKEVDLFYASIKQNILDKSAVKEGFLLFKQRQTTFFRGKYENLIEIDDFFLTMEGIGQYSMFLWLINPKGGNIEKGLAIEGVRRGGRWWSQDEGFALFLILDKLTTSKSWAKSMFGNETESVISLINKLFPFGL